MILFNLSGSCSDNLKLRPEIVTGPKAFIASATDVVYTNLMDDYKLYYNKAGSSTAKNRDAGSSGYANIANVKVYQVPFLDTHAHDGRQHQLLEHVWGDAFARGGDEVKLYVRYLRIKIERDPANPVYLQTARGAGYRLIADG